MTRSRLLFIACIGVVAMLSACTPWQPDPTTTSTTSTTVPTSTTTTTTTTIPDPSSLEPFPTRASTGPRVATTPWTGSYTISDSSKPRDTDGIMRFHGIRFDGPVKLITANVEFIDCIFDAGDDLTGGVNGALWSPSTMPAGTMKIDHSILDAGNTGWVVSALTVYQPVVATVTNTWVTGAADGIRAQSNSLYADNLITMNGVGTRSQPGHIDGIHGEYFKFFWTARHNTIIGGVHPTDAALAAGATDHTELGTNSCVWAPKTANGSAGPSGSYGDVVEDNYCDGGNYGIGMENTDASSPHYILNNTMGKNFRYYPSIVIRPMGGNIIISGNRLDRGINLDTGYTFPI